MTEAAMFAEFRRQTAQLESMAEQLDATLKRFHDVLAEERIVQAIRGFLELS
jgi:predicted RNA binding protein with dsRBD fold (UPF0201 family)